MPVDPRRLRYSPALLGGGEETVYDAIVRHDIAEEPCNFSHTVVNGRENGSELGRNIDFRSKEVRKQLRRQLYQSVVTEIPVEQAGQNLEPGWE